MENSVEELTKSSTEDSTEESVEALRSLLKRISYMVRDGMNFAVYELLRDKSPLQIDQLINRNLLEVDGQHGTPLILAARYGHNNIVRMLLNKFSPDLEQEGTVKFNEYIMSGATAIWCAAGAGHLEIVKILVRAGADVNHVSKNNSTPVRAACFVGRLDIVEYLTKHGADIHIANRLNNTCLMLAASRGHFDVVTFLLDEGANPNTKSCHGETALHLAAEHGHVEIVSKLLKYGAEVTRNERGMTPLIVAAERTHERVVMWLVENVQFSKEEIIEAYELLGASYANNKYSYCLLKAYEYLFMAMGLRYSDPKNVVHKELGETVHAYENWRECETIEQLESIINNPDAIHMESLAIRERILGPYNPDLPGSIIFRGMVFADNARFDRCIDLWLYALSLLQLNNMSLSEHLQRFSKVFTEMIHVSVDVDISQVLSVLEASVKELARIKSKICNPGENDDVEEYVDEMQLNIIYTLHILTILTKLLMLKESAHQEEIIERTHQLVRVLCSLHLQLKNGKSLLHLAVSDDTPTVDFHTNNLCKFPCVATAKLLIRCGADVNAMDNERNTPLHVIVGYAGVTLDFRTLHSIIVELIEAGAHTDTMNSNGKTPCDAVTTGMSGIILRSQLKLSLQCMAAKVVKAHNLSYCGNVPRALESFIELHGPGLNQG